MAYTIEFAKWPINKLGGAVSHNFLVLRDHSGTIIRELNGGKLGPNGTFDYTGIPGEITARETNYSTVSNEALFPRFGIRPETTFTELDSGSETEMLARWAAGVGCADEIDNRGMSK